MTGTSLLLYMRKMNLSYSALIKDVDEGTQALYRDIYDKSIEIASIYKHHHIPHHFAGQIRSLAYYLKDLCEFHERGLSGKNNIHLQRGFEKVLGHLTEIYAKAIGKETDNGLV